jgi:hypothetical protein
LFIFERSLSSLSALTNNKTMSNTGYNDYYGPEGDVVVFPALIIGLGITLICCTVCPPECLVVVGMMKLFASTVLFAVTLNPIAIGGFLGGFLWISVGLARIKTRDEGQSEEPRLGAMPRSALFRVRPPPYTRARSPTPNEPTPIERAQARVDRENQRHPQAVSFALRKKRDAGFQLLPQEVKNDRSKVRETEDPEQRNEEDNGLDRGMTLFDTLQSTVDDSELRRDIEASLAESKHRFGKKSSRREPSVREEEQERAAAAAAAAGESSDDLEMV